MKLIDFLDKHFGNIRITVKLAKDIYTNRITYSVKNAAFFSGGEIGVVPLRFRDAEEDYIFTKILKVDYRKIKKDMPSCKEIPDFKIQGDLLNLTLFYFAHKFLRAKSLTTPIRNQAAKDCILLFCYRTIAAISSNSFIYLANPEVATLTYETLSNKFILKRLGSWEKYMHYRADSVLDVKRSVHYKYLLRFSDTERFLRIISDTQGRIKATFKLIYKLYVEILEKKEKLERKSSTSEEFDEIELADITSRSGTAIESVVGVAGIWNQFYNVKMTETICTLSSNASATVLTKILHELHTRASSSEAHKVHEYIRHSLAWIFDYLSISKLTPSQQKDVIAVLSYVRSGLSSSRSSDPWLSDIRDATDEIVTKVTKKKDGQTIAIYRSSLLMYLFTLALKTWR
jgi:hypothetical protein